jgi:hypothetical protein
MMRPTLADATRREMKESRYDYPSRAVNSSRAGDRAYRAARAGAAFEWMPRAPGARDDAQLYSVASPPNPVKIASAKFVEAENPCVFRRPGTAMRKAAAEDR